MLTDETTHLMRNLANRCRIGALSETTREARGASRYPHMVRHTYSSTLKRAYPIAESILSGIISHESRESCWQHLVDGVLASGSVSDPRIWRMPSFVLGSAPLIDIASTHQLPWLSDLFTFEWSEIEVQMMEHAAPFHPLILSADNPPGEFRYAINPAHLLMVMEYPVFRTSQRHLWSIKGEYYLACFRRPMDFEIRYLELSPLLVTSWEWWGDKDVSIDELQRHIITTFPALEEERVLREVEQTIELLWREGLIVRK